ncbi:MAG: squalene/phytoene synthase family protein [Anaerolineales bacterium]|jgi:phytoene synthase
MSIQTYHWEHSLLEMAHEALESHSIAANSRTDRHSLTLQEAYAHCDEITKQHSRTFYLASRLLSRGKRQAMRALYAFCRVSDNLVDGGANASILDLDDWRYRSLSSSPQHDDLVSLAWADTREKYNIPKKFAEQLIDGVARDLTPIRYGTFAELAAYCYGVASTVGLMAMHIIGYSGKEAVPYAIKLGVALQLTNILRDVGEDWEAGRVYLPQDELAWFGVQEEDIAEGRITPNWKAFLEFQIARNRRLYAEALPGIKYLNRDGRFAVAAAAELYRGILDDIQDHKGDVFNRRAFVSKSEKLVRLPGIWWRALYRSDYAAYSIG